MNDYLADLKLLIDDFGGNTELRELIKSYHSLLGDYMVKRGTLGTIHILKRWMPFR